MYKYYRVSSDKNITNNKILTFKAIKLGDPNSRL